MTLVEWDKSKHGALDAGPVDDLCIDLSATPCPECGEDLDFIGEQRGVCYSGKFSTAVLQDYYECQACCGIFVEVEPCEA